MNETATLRACFFMQVLYWNFELKGPPTFIISPTHHVGLTCKYGEVVKIIKIPLHTSLYLKKNHLIKTWFSKHHSTSSLKKHYSHLYKRHTSPLQYPCPYPCLYLCPRSPHVQSGISIHIDISPSIKPSQRRRVMSPIPVSVSVLVCIWAL